MHLSLLCVFSIVIVSAKVERVLDYHEHVGIPLAKWIKKTEDKIHSRPIIDGRRVVGGGVAPPNFYPYLGGLLTKIVNNSEPSVCGSTLITNTHLVTAAHCWKSQTSQAEQFTVVLASEFLFTGGTRIVTSNVSIHPQYEPNPVINDIAIIYLPAAIVFSETIKPATLPHSHLNDTFVGEWVIAAGYGRTSNDLPVSINSVISHVRLQVIPVALCMLPYGSAKVRPTNICTNGAGGVGICDGDSGGPLVSIKQGQAILVGIASFTAANCESGYPSVFTRVTSYHSFITEHL